MAELIDVVLSELVLDAELQPRENLRKEKVEEYAQRMKDGACFPPIQCGRLKGEGRTLYLLDGFHRVEAIKSLGTLITPGAVEEYETRWEMFEYAFRANNIHGINLTDEEIREGIIRIIKMHPEESLRALADRCGCSKSTIHRYINELSQVGQLKRPEKTIGQDGKARPATQPAKEPEYALCPQCGTPIWPENKGNLDYTYTERNGQWFCSEECADLYEQERLSDEAEALTGIPDELPDLPSAALPPHEEDEQEPVKHDAEPVLTEDDENRQIVEEIAELLKNFRPQRINNILILLFKSLNLNSSHITNIINARRYENSDLPEEEKTSFVWVLNDGSKWILPKSQLETFKTLYPAIDVEQELRNSIGWNLTNQKNRKTKSGIGKHINTWLSNAQNRASCRKNQTGRKSGYVSRDAGLDFENLEY